MKRSEDEEKPEDDEFLQEWDLFEKEHEFFNDWDTFELDYHDEHGTHAHGASAGVGHPEANISVQKRADALHSDVTDHRAHEGTSSSKRSSVRLRVGQNGAGLSLRWRRDVGFLVTSVHSFPGQEGIRRGQYIVGIDGCDFCRCSEEEANAIVQQKMVDGIYVTVQGDVEIVAPLAMMMDSEPEREAIPEASKSEEADIVAKPEDTRPALEVPTTMHLGQHLEVPKSMQHASSVQVASGLSSTVPSMSPRLSPGPPLEIPQAPATPQTTPMGTPRDVPDKLPETPTLTPRSTIGALTPRKTSDKQVPFQALSEISSDVNGTDADAQELPATPTTEAPVGDSPELPKKDAKSSSFMGFKRQSSAKSHNQFFEAEDQTEGPEGLPALVGLRLQQQEMNEIIETWTADKKAKLWMQFDLISGVFVVLNALLIGLQTIDNTTKNSDDKMFSDTANKWFERFFLTVFTVEFVLRVSYLQLAALKDAWMYLDVFLIFTSAADVFGLTDILLGGMGENASMFSIIRAFRLTRLFRVIRLIRLMKELWLLVQGMMLAFRILIWTVILILVAVYMVAILMTEMVGKEAKEAASMDNADAQDGLELGAMYQNWGRLSWSMLTLAQIVTLDSWSKYLRPFYLHRPLLCFLLLAFITISALGVMNLVVGVMCETSIEVSNRDIEVNRRLKFVKEYRALMGLRSQMISRYAMHSTSGRTRKEISDCFFDRGDKRCNRLLHVAGMTLAEVQTLLETMGVYANRKIAVDRLIEAMCWFRGDVKDRALDVFVSSLEAKNLEQTMKRVFASIKNSSSKALLSLKGYKDALDIGEDDVGDRPPGPNPVPSHDDPHWAAERWIRKGEVIASPPPDVEGVGAGASVQMSKQEMDKIEALILQDNIGQASARFDTMSATVVMLNAAMVGLQIDNVGDGAIDYSAIESCFLLFFIVELPLRILLHVQLTIETDFRLMCGCCPRDQLGHWATTFRHIKKALPELSKDPFFMLDVFIIMFSVIDTALYISKVNKSRSGSFLSIVRLLRITRIMRVFRLVKILKQLWLLVSSLVITMRTLLWAVCLLAVFVYIVSILMTETFWDEPWAEDDWGSTYDSTWTLLRLITLDAWMPYLRRVSERSPTFFFVLMFFMVVTALGIMNLVVGIMCQTAVHVVEDSRQSQFRNEMLKLMFDTTKYEVDADFMEAAKSSGDSGHKRKLTHKVLHRMLKDPEMIKKFHDHGRMSPHEIHSVFTKLDPHHTKCVDMDLFIEGLLRLKSTLANDELVIFTLMLKSLKSESDKIQRTVNLFTKDLQVASSRIEKSKAQWAQWKKNGEHHAAMIHHQCAVAAKFQHHQGHGNWRRLLSKEICYLYAQSAANSGTQGPHGVEPLGAESQDVG